MAKFKGMVARTSESIHLNLQVGFRERHWKWSETLESSKPTNCYILSLTRPNHLIPPKQVYQLETTYSNMWAYRNHSHSHQCFLLSARHRAIAITKCKMLLVQLRALIRNTEPTWTQNIAGQTSNPVVPCFLPKDLDDCILLILLCRYPSHVSWIWHLQYLGVSNTIQGLFHSFS